MPEAPTRSDLGRLLPLRARHRLRLGRTLDVGRGVGRHPRNYGAAADRTRLLAPAARLVKYNEYVLVGIPP
ncbi:hypothetical protein ACIRPK_12660 [Kitasatospora sp. NPDC101801]|uniref:hypothetical protein n=1 Tax=Kitasatospora sp. NPDC101801 TaxID=3364103 RepID=UPI0037F3C3C4